jgi:gamma-glutamyltranspeptidase / glutathione hydrolase
VRDFQEPGRGPAYATNGMAATSMPQATLAALDVMRAGGNAMDAAIAAAAVLAVVEPQSTGLGGDCFCLYAPAGGGKVVAVNGSGHAAAAASIDAIEAAGPAARDHHSPHAVTIPGAVSAWDTLAARFGTRDLAALLQPAIAYAEDGYAVGQRVAYDWARNADRLAQSGAGALLPGGRAPRAGDRLTHPALARTLRAIAADGARAFYSGDVAAELVRELRARGGVHTETDFAAGAGSAEFVEPIRLAWKDFEVWQCPPNGSGIIVLMILGILAHLTPPADALAPLRLHRHVEAARLAFRDRDAFVADPGIVDVPVARLLSPEYLRALAALIDDERALLELPEPGSARLPVHRDTVYLSVVDADGNACSFINSIFDSFGSAIYAPRSGIVLHNRGAGFVLDRNHPNELAPGKRPMHTIIPGMLTRDGQAVMPFGVMGGHFQPMGQSLFLTNVLDYGLDLQQAIDLPRLMPWSRRVQVERGIPAAARAGLAARGHDLVDIDAPLGGGQAIWIDRERGCLIGASDPRKDGIALGY